MVLSKLSRTSKPRKAPPTTCPFYSVSYTNIRGLRGNLPEVATHALEEKPDLFFMSETLVKTSGKLEEPQIEVNKNDLPSLVGYSDPHVKQQGHGLAAYVKEGFPCSRFAKYEHADAPYMCFRVSLVHSTSFIFALYRPQKDGTVIFDQIGQAIDSILSENPYADIHICGDFNVHHGEWLIHSNKTTPEGRYCHDFAVAYDLTQTVTKPTRVPDATGQYANLLDLFLTSCPEKCSTSVLSPLGSSDHCVVSVKVDTKSDTSTDVPFHRTVFRYSKADWDSFRSFMADAPLSHFFNQDADKAACLTSEWIIAGMEAFIPSKTYQKKPNSQPWYTPECAAAIAHRNHFFHLYQKSQSEDSLAAFKKARNHCKAVLRKAKSSYAQSIKDKIGGERLGSREFWRITNQVQNRGKKSSIPTLINGPEIVSSSADKAKIFASIFASNSTLDDQGHEVPFFPTVSENQIDTPWVTAKDVARRIRELESSKATGPDKIPVVVLKNLSPELSPILAKLFNKCIQEECFPDCWKLSAVCPVFKNSGDQSLPSQYRPISLLSIISKLFESVINTDLVAHLEKNGLFSDFQYGFRASRSTADILTVITSRISSALDGGHISRAIALDISKAFDKVWHEGLLHKVSCYGITGKTFSVVKSFLTSRSLKVVVNGQSSDAHPINAGVPQGSLLGPTLFLLFINDLPNDIIRSLIDIFADDTTLYGHTSCHVTDEILADSLNTDLNHVVQWGKKWLVGFNSLKTKLLSFHHRRSEPNLPTIRMENASLSEAASFDKLLGLKFTPDLKWNSYIESVAKETAKMVGSLHRSKRYLTPPAILYLYKSQIRPRMEYCCHIWAGSAQTSLSSLDAVQKRLRSLVGDELFGTLQPLSHRRDVSSLSLLYRYFHGRCSEELHQMVPPLKEFGRSTRLASRSHPYVLDIPKAKSKFHSQSFFPRTASIWNRLPQSSFPNTYDLGLFKSRVNKLLPTLS